MDIDQETDAAVRERIADENQQANDLPTDRAEPATEPVDPPTRDKPEAEADKPEPKIGSRFDDKRSRIAKKHMERRDQGEQESTVEPVSDDRERFMLGDNVEKRSDRAAQRQAADAPQDTATDPENAPETRQRTLKVHGRDVTVSEEEVVRLAQKAAAADNLLDDARQHRSEMKTLLEELRAARADQSSDAQPDQAAQDDADQPDQLSDTELDTIIDQIQVGSPEEAKQALMKFGDQIIERQSERIGDIDARIDNHIRSREEVSQRRREIDATVADFREKNPWVGESKSMARAFGAETVDVMREELAKINDFTGFYNDLVTKHRMQPHQAVAYTYRDLQAQGVDLPSHKDVLEQAGTRLRKVFSIPEQRQDIPSQDPERLERKQSLGPQPRRATAAPTGDAAQRSREDVRRDAVRQMKLARRGKR